jgi:hypothetical protein
MNSLPCKVCGGSAAAYGPIAGDEHLTGAKRHEKGSFLVYCHDDQSHPYAECASHEEALAMWNIMQTVKPNPAWEALTPEITEAVNAVVKGEV